MNGSNRERLKMVFGHSLVGQWGFQAHGLWNLQRVMLIYIGSNSHYVMIVSDSIHSKRRVVFAGPASAGKVVGRYFYDFVFHLVIWRIQASYSNPRFQELFKLLRMDVCHLLKRFRLFCACGCSFKEYIRMKYNQIHACVQHAPHPKSEA